MDQTFFIYLTTSGAGTHIMRSFMMDLNNRGVVGPIDHNEFWAKAAAAIRFPQERGFDEFEEDNFSIFKSHCKKYGIDILNEELTNNNVFNIFEEIYFKRKKLTSFDFSRKYTTVEDMWGQEYVDALQELIVSYMHYSKKKIRLKFIVQVRNPLDHIASLCERFGHKKSILWRNVVLSNLLNIEKILPRLPEKDYVFLTLEDLVFRLNYVKDSFLEKFGLEVPSNYYRSSLSINKWLSCFSIYQFLDDKELLDVAKRFSYAYLILPKPMRFIYAIIGFFKREILELKFVVDMAKGKVNIYNPIMVKHKKKGIFAKLYLVVLYLAFRKKYSRIKNQAKKFSNLLTQHNAKD